MTPFLPNELIGRIASYIELPAHLVSLLLVSRVFYAEAERHLYRSVIFHGSKEKWPLLWQTRGMDRVGKFITSLSVEFKDQDDFAVSLREVLLGLPNLGSLVIQGSLYWSDLEILFYHSNEFPFLLHTLSMDVTFGHPLVTEFLSNQSSVVDLTWVTDGYYANHYPLGSPDAPIPSGETKRFLPAVERFICSTSTLHVARHLPSAKWVKYVDQITQEYHEPILQVQEIVLKSTAEEYVNFNIIFPNISVMTLEQYLVCFHTR